MEGGNLLDPIFWREADSQNLLSLLEGGADIAATDENDRLPLHWAANWASPPVIRTLIASGARDQVNARDCTGRTPLHMAVRNAYPEVVHLLLDEGSEIDAQNVLGLTPLHVAAGLLAKPMMRALKERGANEGLLTAAGNTARQILEIRNSPN